MTIHGEHPFLPPESERSPVRRLRGRLPAGVTLWTSQHAGRRSGLPVSSMLVADGEPGLVLALLDPDSELWETASRSRTVAVSLLGWADRALSDAFAGTAPAPGGPFRLAEWRDTDWGPVLESTSVFAGCRLLDSQPRAVGWALLVEAEIEQVEIGGGDIGGGTEQTGDALIHHRGRYHRL
ncbi:MAG TPA: flavin reductase family protein [Nocardioidaceae bacterium]|nr:flavin reductase family protein [Nocardioidaceae bacterium]